MYDVAALVLVVRLPRFQTDIAESERSRESAGVGQRKDAVGLECDGLVDGKIVVEGDAALAKRIDEEGYDWIYRDYGVQPASEAERRKAPVSLGSCAVAQKAQGK